MDNIGYVLTNGTSYFGENNIAVVKIRSAKIYNDKSHAEYELQQEKEFAKMKSFEDYLIYLSCFYAVPVVVNNLENNEMIDAIKNLLAIIDTPIGRRKNKSEFSTEAIKIATDVIEKYKI